MGDCLLYKTWVEESGNELAGFLKSGDVLRFDSIFRLVYSSIGSFDFRNEFLVVCAMNLECFVEFWGRWQHRRLAGGESVGGDGENAV